MLFNTQHHPKFKSEVVIKSRGNRRIQKLSPTMTRPRKDAVCNCTTHQKKYHVRRDYSKIQSVNSFPRKSDELMSIFLFSIHISKPSMCQGSVGDYRQIPNSFKSSNLFGFNDFRHLSARSRNKLAKQ